VVLIALICSRQWKTTGSTSTNRANDGEGEE
jgi:hypothetical protein